MHRSDCSFVPSAELLQTVDEQRVNESMNVSDWIHMITSYVTKNQKE
jgi:hypothetical protein